MEIKIGSHKFLLKHERVSLQPEDEPALEQQSTDTFSIEDLKSSLDRVNSWLGNVDQKSGMLLAIEGVILTVTCTSDALKGIFNLLKSCVFSDFCICNSGTWAGMFCLLSLLLALLSIGYASCAISATIDPEEFKKRNPSLLTNSMLHFVCISQRSYQDFRNEVVSEEKQKNDLYSQIYMNSHICTRKFGFYKTALLHFQIMLASAVITLIFILIHQL